MPKKRPTWDEFWMKFAVVASERSACLRYRVGAAIVRDKSIITIGYNGPVSGDSHCSEVGCAKEGILPAAEVLGFCRGAHAELNAILNAAKQGVSIEGTSLYVTYRPCYSCAKHIVNAGIKRVIYLYPYNKEPEAIELFRKTGVDLIPFPSLSDKNFFPEEKQKAAIEKNAKKRKTKGGR